ncbi:MAG: anaerobic ribonucleoside-triphosphate reductase activating protein [Clostridiales bacterium]|nr:anaerobic ribonucleoside-triphosphate reductase activating protein [Clostridiales bacterium]
MKIAEIKTNDIANGEGVRTSVFVSGCRHHCPDCFNEIAWSFDYGREFDGRLIDEIIESAAPPWIAGLSLLGGEPFEAENQPGLAQLLAQFKKRFPQKTVWCYSGFTFEEITGRVPSRAAGENADKLLNMIDILVDGRFIKEMKNISLKFRGSENQRVIDVKESLKQNKIVLYLE